MGPLMSGWLIGIYTHLMQNAKNKTAELCDFVIGHPLNIETINETWFTHSVKDNCAFADNKNTLPKYITPPS